MSRNIATTLTGKRTSGPARVLMSSLALCRTEFLAHAGCTVPSDTVQCRELSLAKMLYLTRNQQLHSHSQSLTVLQRCIIARHCYLALSDSCALLYWSSIQKCILIIGGVLHRPLRSLPISAGMRQLGAEMHTWTWTCSCAQGSNAFAATKSVFLR